jgi:CRISPR/Cas system-associated exonuclease Cas4 (RecB family)
MAPYPIVLRYPYPKFDAVTLPTGRTYTTPLGDKVPSVTTILDIVPKPQLDAWRLRLGETEANRVSEEACEIGTTMHDHLEGYVSNFLQGRPDIPPMTDKEKLAYSLADNIKRDALIDLDECWGIEEALYCHNLYAGRTDLLGVYLGKTAVIDYKSSTRWKKSEWLEGYKMQLAAYNLCHKTMFGVGMQSGVILIAIRPPCGKPPVQRVILDESELDRYEDKWLAVVARYYDERDKAIAA